MINQMLDSFEKQRKKKVILNDEIKYTTNLFESNEVLKTASLILFEQGVNGDCMCLVNNSYLVDVDRRDIQRII